jgi:hypothetical protein
MYTADSTNNAKFHLKKLHGGEIEAHDSDDSDDASPGASVLDIQRAATKKRPLVAKSAAEKFKSALIEGITSAHIPFQAVENEAFRHLLATTRLVNDKFLIDKIDR